MTLPADKVHHSLWGPCGGKGPPPTPPQQPVVPSWDNLAGPTDHCKMRPHPLPNPNHHCKGFKKNGRDRCQNSSPRTPSPASLLTVGSGEYAVCPKTGKWFHKPLNVEHSETEDNVDVKHHASVILSTGQHVYIFFKDSYLTFDYCVYIGGKNRLQ